MLQPVTIVPSAVSSAAPTLKVENGATVSSAGALGIPIQKIKGITGQIARENAIRNPKRTSATAAALMIGVALVGLITVFAASARTSVNAAIDRSMKADYVITSPGFGQGSIPIEAQRSLAGCSLACSRRGWRIPIP